MVKKLKEQLEIRKEWLEDAEKNYTPNDFLEDWKEYQRTIEKAHYLELVSGAYYLRCKEVLMDYMYLFQQR